MNIDDVTKAKGLLYRRDALRKWQGKEDGCRTFVLFETGAHSLLADYLKISIALNEARQFLERELARIEKELADLGVELGGEE
jgi:hypothetical protein